MKSVLFVCFGNICRSTMAEAVFLDLIKKKDQEEQWRVDSAGHGNWHIGKPAEPRTVQVLANHGIIGYTHIAREITEDDFYRSDYILVMDDYNLSNLEYLKPQDSKCHIQLLGDYDPEGIQDIFDPYFSNSLETYEEVYRQCHRCCKSFLNHVAQP